MREAHDHSKLKWIRTELESLITESSRALEEYAEGAGGKELIDSCIDRLHQVRGTLQVIQLYGAAMLVEEMELVAIALRDEKVSQRGAAIEALTLGLVHLPSYLEKLERGARDIPLLILPMLNELRAARDASLLSEVALFAPELERILGSERIEGDPNPMLQELARQLRVSYHQGLIKWYRNTDVDDGLKTIGSVLSELSRQAGTDKVRRLFKVGWAVTVGLREERGSKPGFAFKELFGKLDREIKRIIDVGEGEAAAAPTRELLKSFLYYVASSDSNNQLLEEIRQTFGLQQLIFSKEEMDQERASLRALDKDLLVSLRTAIGADLTRIKDGLDLFMRTAENDSMRLRELEAPLRKVADTLGMIGQGALRERLKQQADTLQALDGQASDADEQMLMSLAGDILFIETSLENLASVRRKSEAAIVQATSGTLQLPQGEFERLTDSVLQEAEVEMAKIREAIVNYIATPSEPELLKKAPGRFKRVAGAFTILNQERAARLLDGLSDYVQKALLKGVELPPAEDLNRFADALTSVEYFMEGITEGRGVQPEILQIAEESLLALGYPQAFSSGTVETAVVRPEESEAGAGKVVESEQLMLEPSEPEDEHEKSEPAVAPSIEQELVDPEILEIFMEEAGEELRTIQSYLPRWCSDTEDSEALTTIRRSFHTLKGSGRLVGATAIGEFAWAIENLLNRVIDRTVSISDDLLALLRQSLQLLPDLLESQGTSDAGVIAKTEPIITRAFQLADVVHLAQSASAEAAAVELTAEPPHSDEQQDVSVALESKPEPVSGELIRIDSDLAAIYIPETREHIGELDSFVSDCRRDADNCILGGANITRALHTLHGSAEMAGVEPIALLSTALENHIKQLIAAEIRVADQSLLALVQECGTCFSSLVDAINKSDAPLPDWRMLLDRIKKETQQVQATVAAQELQKELEQAQAEASVEVIEEKEERLSDLVPEPEVEELLQPMATTQKRAPALPSDTQEFDQIEGDGDLIELFSEEARELLESLEQSLSEWRENPQGSAPLNDLQRTLHTLKGGARLAGIPTMGDLSHAFETLLSGIDQQRPERLAEIMQLAQRVSDRLAEQVDDLAVAPRVRRCDDLMQQLERLSGVEESTRKRSKKRDKPVPAVSSEPADAEPEEGALPQAAYSAMPERLAAEKKAPRGRRELLRVPADLMDKLVNNAGEVSIYRARLEQQNNTLGFNLKELEQTVDRLRSQLRSLDMETEAQILFRYERDKDERDRPETAFDPLELDRFSTIQQLSRSLLETVNDLTNINGYLEDLNKETETLLLQQARVATDLQDGLLYTRMVPFAQLVPRLQRVVRQTAASLDKQAELRVKGAEGGLDRGILDRMIGPLEHILRNALSHGIESPERRRALGKSDAGTISLDLIREGNDIVVSITDDGAGLDTDAIRRQAIESGLLDAAVEVPESDVIQFVLEHGFSTKKEVTQISGRGVGLDVVIKEVKNLGGSLDIASTRGRGSTFTIRLPLTLAIADALLVELAEEIYAVPHISVEGVVRVSKTELLALYNSASAVFNYADQEYLVRYLGTLMNVGPVNLSEQKKWYPLLLVRAGEHRVALQVDGVIGNRQIVVKPVGPQIGSVRWISGGTILGDGRVALILDVTALVRMDVARAVSAPPALAPAMGTSTQTVVMVVDDSITVRKVTGRVLERNGMKVITAKDGVDAVALLQEQLPDVMLLDIEMPRMDGYELVRHMRNTEELKSIPIIMITSRTGDKHRQLALELGVKRYLGKPYQEAELLDNIYAVLAEESP